MTWSPQTRREHAIAHDARRGYSRRGVRMPPPGGGLLFVLFFHFPFGFLFHANLPDGGSHVPPLLGHLQLTPTGGHPSRSCPCPKASCPLAAPQEQAVCGVGGHSGPASPAPPAPCQPCASAGRRQSAWGGRGGDPRVRARPRPDDSEGTGAWRLPTAVWATVMTIPLPLLSERSCVDCLSGTSPSGGRWP